MELNTYRSIKTAERKKLAELIPAEIWDKYPENKIDWDNDDGFVIDAKITKMQELMTNA